MEFSSPTPLPHATAEQTLFCDFPSIYLACSLPIFFVCFDFGGVIFLFNHWTVHSICVRDSRGEFTLCLNCWGICTVSQPIFEHCFYHSFICIHFFCAIFFCATPPPRKKIIHGYPPPIVYPLCRGFLFPPLIKKKKKEKKSKPISDQAFDILQSSFSPFID